MIDYHFVHTSNSAKFHFEVSSSYTILLGHLTLKKLWLHITSATTTSIYIILYIGRNSHLTVKVRVAVCVRHLAKRHLVSVTGRPLWILDLRTHIGVRCAQIHLAWATASSSTSSILQSLRSYHIILRSHRVILRH
jgi:hypothetical protein